MVKRVLKRQFALLICFMVAFTMLLPSWVFSVDLAYAATVQTEIDGLTASYDAGTWTASGNTLNGSATGKAKGQCDDASAETSTLTLKNTSGATALLAFDYAKPTLGSGGSVTIDGTARTAAGSFTKELANNESVTVVILSGNAGAYTSSIELTNVKIVPVRQVTTTFAPPQAHGSIAVGGTQITDTAAYTRSSTEAYELKATPDAGYKLMGWYGSVDGYFSTSETLTTYFSSDQTITAVFIDKDAPVFEVGDEWFTDLNEAHAYAVSSGIAKIVLVADGTLPAGNYTIGAGKTLLIPYENSYIVSTTKPGTYRSVTPTAPSKYRQLTVASGANITVNGAICVNAKVNSYNNAYTGATSGKYGYLYLNPGSSVTLNSGANLYCWGYIAGKGEITAKSGAKVYEPFEIADIRGGTATSGMNGNAQKVMPFSQ
ncbi:MAG: hypothetical protein IIY88_06545, partial [Eubacterium sp.]|nr:hypothetical protein [Eubacterium sp.]